MSTTRIWAAGVAALLGLLLVAVAIVSFGPEDEVLPEVSVAAEQGSQGGSTATILKDRTAMQRWRQASGPSPDKQPPADATGSGEKLIFRPGVDDPAGMVRSWQQNEPGTDIMRPSENVSGTSSLPYPEANSFEQPGGRTWRAAHNDQVRYGGGWIIFGIGLTLAMFLLYRGRIGLEKGFSGKTVERFNAFERANHWLTASAFILMALTGLVLMYGKPLLLPLVGHDAMGTIALASAWLHMASAVPFVLGVIVMIAIWVVDNIPRQEDWTWIKQGGGFMSDDGPHPPARKFNAGQKLVFWGVILGGLALLASGVTLMFPFFWFGYDGMQIAQTSHAVIGLLMITLIIGHIYIGTVGMKGAFDAMWSGQVDREWAREHHSIWYQGIGGPRRKPESRQRRQPAE